MIQTLSALLGNSPFRCPLKCIKELHCTLGSMKQASSSSSTSLLRELCVPLVKEDTLGSMLLLEPLVSDLHLLSSTISSLGSGLQSEIMQKRAGENDQPSPKMCRFFLPAFYEAISHPVCSQCKMLFLYVLEKTFSFIRIYSEEKHLFSNWKLHKFYTL